MILLLLVSLFAQAGGRCDPENNVCTPVDFSKKRAGGENEQGCFYSKSIASNVCYTVTFPKNFPAVEPMPFVTYLHGRGGNDRQFTDLCKQCATNAELPDCFDEAPPFPIVAVSQTKHTYWKNSPDGKIKSEDLVTKDLLEHLPPVFSKNASERGLLGISMGGHGATYISMKHPKVYAAGFYAISPIFRGEKTLLPEDRAGFGEKENFAQRDPNTLLRNNSSLLKQPPFRMEIASDDGLFLEDAPTRDFFALAAKNHRSRVSVAGKGGHAAPFWCGALRRSMDFFSKEMPAVAPAGTDDSPATQIRRAP